MGRPPPTKTFGMRVPTDLYEKLLYDINRLRSARSSADSKYAAFDCAVDAWHLVDWTLHVVDDDAYERLSGFKRGGPTRKGKLTIEASFKDLQEDRLSALKYCHMLANSVKHREVRTDLMPNVWSGNTAILSWSKPENDSDRSIMDISVLTYVTVDGERYNAIQLFEDMAAQWRAFLIREGLFEFRPQEPDDE
jgi:hypothetical protein